MKREQIIEMLKKLPVISKAENTWKNKKLVSVTLKLVELDKVIEIIADELQDKELSDDEIREECGKRFVGNIGPTYFTMGAKWYREQINK